ncbi:hypothetical protein RRG08_040640 [Elysia crispata]|uniref:Uncharacterized protein n=1 Tax=Elysia crispata TaxID=231223 RepID=A0AAE1E910_9GAST|nr:hypothetical protein RRG08_040640 [Elysia crispata]
MTTKTRSNLRKFLMTSSLLISALPPLQGSKDMVRLMKLIFTDYDTAIWPRINSSTPIELELGIGIIAVVNLDTKDQTVYLTGYITAYWVDEYLRWNPEEFGNISYLTLSQNTIWKPDLGLIRSLDPHIYFGTDETMVRIYSDGRVRWEPNFNSRFTCKVDVGKFPLDVNICKVSLSSWMYSSEFLTLKQRKIHTYLEPGITNGEFDIAVEEPIHTTLYYEGLPQDMLSFRIKLSRKPAHTFISLLMPMFVIGLLSPISFLIPADETEKVGLSLNILLATTVCIGVVSGNLPDRSDKTSSVALFVVFLLVLSFFGVLGNTIVLLVHRREESCETLTKLSNPSTCDTRILPECHARNEIQCRPEDVDEPCRVQTGNQNSPRSKAESLNWLFFGLNILGLVLSFLAVIVQIMI